MLHKVLILVSISFVYGQLNGPPNFIFRDFFQCVDKSTPINASIKQRWINKTYQVIDANVTTPVPIGDNLNAKIVAYKLVGNKWIHMANITSKWCQLLRNYLGPVRKVVLGAIGFTENTCPVPEGSYRSRNIHLDMKESRIPVFPIGTFKIHMALHNVKNDLLQVCLGILMENNPYQ